MPRVPSGNSGQGQYKVVKGSGCWKGIMVLAMPFVASAAIAWSCYR